MSGITVFAKQPGETIDYDLDFSEYLAALNDEAQSYTVFAEPGVTLIEHTLNDGVVKVWLSGGTDKAKYKVTVRLTTTGGRVKEADFILIVREL